MAVVEYQLAQLIRMDEWLLPEDGADGRAALAAEAARLSEFCSA